jgi:hypothetical protein
MSVIGDLPLELAIALAMSMFVYAARIYTWARRAEIFIINFDFSLDALNEWILWIYCASV